MANNDTGSSSRTFPPDDSNHEEIAVDFVIGHSTNELRGPGGKYISKYTAIVKKQEPWKNLENIVWGGFGELGRRGLLLPLYIQDSKYDILVERALEGSDEVGWKPYLLFAEDYHKVFGDFSSNSKIVIGMVQKQVAAQTTIQTTDSSSRDSLPHGSNQEDGEEIAVDFVIEGSTNELRGPGGKYISRYTTMVKKQEPWNNLKNIVCNGIGELARRGLFLPPYIRDGEYDILVERALMEGSDEVEWKYAFIFEEDYDKVFGDFSLNSKIVIGIVQKQVAAQTTIQNQQDNSTPFSISLTGTFSALSRLLAINTSNSPTTPPDSLTNPAALPSPSQFSAAVDSPPFSPSPPHLLSVSGWSAGPTPSETSFLLSSRCTQTSTSSGSSSWHRSSPAQAEVFSSWCWACSKNENENEDGARSETVAQRKGCMGMRSTGSQSRVRYRGPRSSQKKDAWEET